MNLIKTKLLIWSRIFYHFFFTCVVYKIMRNKSVTHYDHFMHIIFPIRFSFLWTYVVLHKFLTRYWILWVLLPNIKIFLLILIFERLSDCDIFTLIKKIDVILNLNWFYRIYLILSCVDTDRITLIRSMNIVMISLTKQTVDVQ